MNAHTLASEGVSAGATVAPQALALAATNGDVLGAIARQPLKTPGEVAHATGRSTKNMARDMGALIREGLVLKADGEHPYRLTPAGDAALLSVDLAQGRRALPPEATDAPDEQASDVLSLRHDQIRPNPLNLRKDGQSADIESLADSIEAAGDVLQNLVVFPADGDGIHTLSAGERRWRAVGLLIEQGRWPADRRLRAIARDNTAGQTSFIALVENGQRQNLTLIEEARGYQALVEETGWSARHAAHQTGRDPRTVQEMLKVLREADPADVARHEADPRDLTWEALRDSVKAGREGRGVEEEVEAGIAAYWKTHPLSPAAHEAREREPVQADIEDVAGGGGEGLSAHEREVRARLRAKLPTLNAKQLMALVELADKIEREPFEPSSPFLKTRVGETYPDRTGVVQALLTNAGVGFQSGGGQPRLATLHKFTFEWLEEVGLRPSKGDRDLILGGVRLKASGMDNAAEAARLNAYLTPWLAEDYTPEGSPFAPQPMAGAGYSAIPTPKADVPLRALNPVETLAMVELAALLQGEDTITDRDGAPMVPVHQYWLDATASELRALGLVVFVHNVQGASRPYAGMPKAGRDWIAQHYPEGVTPEVLDAVEDLVDQAGLARAPERHEMDGAPCYATPWLNLPPLTAAGAEPPEGDDSLPLETPADDAEEEDDDPAEAQALLAEITEQLLSADDFDRAAVFRRLGITFPLRAAPAPATGLVLDANGQAVFTVDQEGAFHDDAAAARVLALVAALNAAVAEDERPLDPLDLPAADKPAVPIRQSITVDAITCLEDGRTFTSLRAHLRATYGLTPDAYRLRWDLPADYPMLAPRTAQNRQDAGSRLWSW